MRRRRGPQSRSSDLQITGACLQFKRPHQSGAIHCKRGCATRGPLAETKSTKPMWENFIFTEPAALLENLHTVHLDTALACVRSALHGDCLSNCGRMRLHNLRRGTQSPAAVCVHCSFRALDFSSGNSSSFQCCAFILQRFSRRSCCPQLAQIRA